MVGVTLPAPQSLLPTQSSLYSPGDQIIVAAGKYHLLSSEVETNSKCPHGTIHIDVKHIHRPNTYMTYAAEDITIGLLTYIMLL